MAVGGNLVDEFKARPVIISAFAAFWACEAAMNFAYGWNRAGFGLACVLLAFAVVAAWLPIKIKDLWRGQRDARLGALICAGPAAALAACVIVSQVACWATLGTMLADGGARREVAATSSSLAGETLARLRAQRAALELPTKAKGALEHELNLELRKTSRQFPDGDGPQARKLKAEIATWDDAARLDGEIQDAMGKLETGPAVAGGAPDVMVLQKLFGGSPRDITFWFTVALASFIGFFANFGFALAGVGNSSLSGASGARSAPAPFETYDWGPKRLGAGGAQQLHDELVALYGGPSDAHGSAASGPTQPHRGDASDAETDRLVAALTAALNRGQHPRTPPAPHEIEPRPPLTGEPPPSVFDPFARTPSGNVHGAPINIHVGLPGSTPERATPTPRADASLSGPSDGSPSGASAAHPQPHQAQPRQAEILPPLLTGPPVDRAQSNRRLDQLLTFKAARLEAVPGALVPADDMYACYAAWAGQRRMSAAAFHALLSELADVPQTAIGEHLHYYDFAIRTTAPRAVAG
ncbi:MAG TPA: hypothetical protein PK857_00455 [Hyphomicrobium sp.]|nr:hypothetical protein [Hyphomicrobium sp.]